MSAQNWVKKVASAVLFEQKGCRHHNIRTTREARRCHHRKPTTIQLTDFLARVRGEACQQQCRMRHTVCAEAVPPNATFW